MNRATPRTTPPPVESCRVTIINDVMGTVKHFHSPQSVADAIRNRSDVAAANAFIEEGCFRGDDDLPIDVAIRKTDHAVVVHWHVVGDREEARYVMNQILNGVGRCEL